MALFISARRLWKETAQAQKSVLGSSSGEDGFSVC
jgi:hypothetical protein